MKKIWTLAFIFITIICILTGCWNYREIEQLAIVSGVAIDKHGEENVLVTVEIVSVDQSQQGSATKPVYIQSSGKTFFEAVRSMVAIQGKKLYWSHAKSIVISKDIASEGLSKAMDFFNRDTEIREDLWILISREKTASEIFNTKPIFEKLVGFELDDTMRAQKSISRYPSVELYEFFDDIASDEAATILPSVEIISVKGVYASHVTGAAIIKKDKLIGFLNEIDSKSLLWIKNELKGGIYSVKHVGGTKTDVSLEILKNKTRIKPAITDGKLTINISVTTDVNIGEILGNDDFISEEPRQILEMDAEAQVKKDIEKVIEKAQKEYKTDFLDFGKHVKRSMPVIWKSIEKDWNDIFEDIEINVEADIRIRGSSTTKKPMKVGR